MVDSARELGRTGGFKRSATGSIYRRAAFDLIVAPDTVHAREFVNCDGSDETTGMRNALLAAKNKRLIMPTGQVKVSSSPGNPALALDPDASYLIDGQSSFPGSGSRILDIGTGRTISIDNSASLAQADRSVVFRNFLVEGNDLSLEGIYANQITNLQIRGMWVANVGGHGIYMTRCFNSTVGDHTYITRSGQHGFFGYSAMNNVVLDKCRIIGNSRKTGYANISFAAAGTDYNYGVSIVDCDWSYAGTIAFNSVLPTEAYGLLLNKCYGVSIRKAYVEQVAAANLGANYKAAYIAACKSVEFSGGGFIMDGQIEWENDNTECSMTGPNMFLRVARATGVTVLNIATPGNFRYVDQSAAGGTAPVFTWTGTGVSKL